MQMEDGVINPNSMWPQAHLVGLLCQHMLLRTMEGSPMLAHTYFVNT